MQKTVKLKAISHIWKHIFVSLYNNDERAFQIKMTSFFPDISNKSILNIYKQNTSFFVLFLKSQVNSYEFICLRMIRTNSYESYRIRTNSDEFVRKNPNSDIFEYFLKKVIFRPFFAKNGFTTKSEFFHEFGRFRPNSFEKIRIIRPNSSRFVRIDTNSSEFGRIRANSMPPAGTV